MGEGRSIEVFISYSHKDDHLQKKLDVHLATLKRQGLVKLWHNRVIEAGAERVEEIKTHLESAQIVLLLISPDFMASDYCYEFEMQRALERHEEGTAKVIPIILRPTDLKEAPFSNMQVLPTGGNAITLSKNQDAAFVNVAEGIRQVIETLLEQGPKNLVGNRKIPPLLPYLANRNVQDFQLGKALEKCHHLSASKPIICIVYGDEFQCHDMFLECLKQVYLPRMLKERQTPITAYPLRWPTRLKSVGELNSRLKKNLADTILKKSFASVEDINKRLAAHPGPVMLHTHLLTEDWRKHGSKVAEGFMEFWQQWPPLTSHQELIIFLFIKYQVKKNLGWFKRQQFKAINRQISQKLDALSTSNFSRFDRLIGVVLPELTNVTRTEVENWAYKEETIFFWGEEMIGELIGAIGNLFEDWERKNSSSEIPMDNLAKSLTNLLKTCPAEKFL